MMERDPILEPLDFLVGTWTTKATHPALPGVVVRGTVVIEWLEGKQFVIHRASNEHPDFPDSISIIGITARDRVESAEDTSPAPDGQLEMHYYDSRGVYRVYRVAMDVESWRIWRDAPGFSQRFSGAIADGGDAIAGRWQLNRDGRNWADDLQITYRRQ